MFESMEDFENKPQDDKKKEKGDIDSNKYKHKTGRK